MLWSLSFSCGDGREPEIEHFCHCHGSTSHSHHHLLLEVPQTVMETQGRRLKAEHCKGAARDLRFGISSVEQLQKLVDGRATNARNVSQSVTVLHSVEDHKRRILRLGSHSILSLLF